ncbi:pectinesterase-like [Nymphaea colorata]|nr:pectinesterase-like [Nymphaea colorata]
MARQPRLDEPLIGSPSKTKSLSQLLFLGVSVVAILCFSLRLSFHGNSSDLLLMPVSPQVCATTLHPDSCSNTFVSAGTTPVTAATILGRILEESIQSLPRHVGTVIALTHKGNNGKREAGPLADCLDLMDQTESRLVDSLNAVAGHPTAQGTHADVHTWLSAALTNYVTCLDGLDGTDAELAMESEVKSSMALLSTSLAVLNQTRPTAEPILGEVLGEFPAWLSPGDRKLLTVDSWDKAVKADVVVAQDGSGKYTTVTAAVNAAPSGSSARYVIYVKKGTYKEQVSIPKTKKNIMLVGDGMGSTIITGSLNVVDGSTTFNSATVAAVGDGFMAQDIWFQNTAGAVKQQAVALRVGADQSIIYRCRIDGYQDTLYTHSLRQFYRDCSISGTVDYIFGNAAVVFQNCQIISRKPLSKQKNTITAQGRTDPNQNTAISIQMCKILASSDLAPVKSTFPTYLGRPWKLYSRTIFMESFLDDLIAPAGWLEWSGSFALNTLEYREYMNTGSGAGTSKRVTWAGYHATTSTAEAQKFTVANLIQGASWLKSAGVSFTEGL